MLTQSPRHRTPSGVTADETQRRYASQWQNVGDESDACSGWLSHWKPLSIYGKSRRQLCLFPHPEAVKGVLWAVSRQGSSPIRCLTPCHTHTHMHCLPPWGDHDSGLLGKKKSERGERKKSERVKETGSQCMCVTASELAVRHNYGRLVKPHWEPEWEPSGTRDNDLWDRGSHTSHTHTQAWKDPHGKAELSGKST